MEITDVDADLSTIFGDLDGDHDYDYAMEALRRLTEKVAAERDAFKDKIDQLEAIFQEEEWQHHLECYDYDGTLKRIVAIFGHVAE